MGNPRFSKILNSIQCVIAGIAKPGTKGSPWRQERNFVLSATLRIIPELAEQVLANDVLMRLSIPFTNSSMRSARNIKNSICHFVRNAIVFIRKKGGNFALTGIAPLPGGAKAKGQRGNFAGTCARPIKQLRQ